ncbi:ATP-binding cassette domain-containing protein [Trinickia dinghuensis]|uniref:ABC transporter ATP-binding protein n=1 Tax=Trinickia dinghuensis TaxID=2291023 RepID=A0A3D8JQ52_9BURK|nr:ABC transporter ATP-binding protein [Trinickia dinghuensis]RDU94571.1 ABC transporter ATP-binding protein [Trinickia dinghuensis]
MEMIESERAIAVRAAHGNAAERVVLVESLSDRVSEQFTLTIPAFRVNAGSVVAVIGPNGAGKSTLLAHLFGERSATHATVRVLGCRAGALPVRERQRIGVQWQEAGYNERYLVRDIRSLHERAYRVSRPEIFDAFDLGPLARSRFGSLSSGEKQRLQLAMAMAHSPDLLILDEPTSNLDPRFTQVFCRLLADMAQSNARFSCLVITHCADVVAICDEILMLQAGSIAHHGPRNTIIRQQFGPVGCSFTGLADARREVQLRLTRGGLSIHPKTIGQTLTVHGGEALRAAALDAARDLPLARFALWETGAADLLESINHG